MSDNESTIRIAKVKAAKQGQQQLFGDSEEEYFETLKKAQTPKYVPTPKSTPPPPSKSTKTVSAKTTSAKPPPKRRHQESDDEESVPRRRPTQAKRKQPLKSEEWRTLDSESDGEIAKQPQRLTSTYSKRVADGVVRRTAYLEGGLYLDLKLYQVDDIKNVHPAKRWEKAVLALRLQGDHDSPEFTALRQLLRCSRVKFPEEGIFFNDVCNFNTK